MGALTVVWGKLVVGDGFVTVGGQCWREDAWEREGERVIVKISLLWGRRGAGELAEKGERKEKGLIPEGVG